MKLLHNQRGSSVLMAAMGLLLLAGMGATTVAVVSSNQEGRTITLAKEQSFGLAQAGTEWAKYQIDQGGNPAVQNYALGEGSFNVAAVPASGGLTVTGQVGSTKKTFNLNATFGKDCTDLDVSTAVVAGPNINGMKLNKSCLSKSTVTDWTVSWTPNQQERSIKLQVIGDQLMTLYDNPNGFASGEKIDAADFVLTRTNVPYPVNKMEFNNPLPRGKTYTVTLHLKDGSQVSKSFVDTLPNAPPPPPGGDQTPGYTVQDNGNVRIDAQRNVTIRALCAEITYGAGGPKIPVKSWLGVNGMYQSLFQGNAINGGESQTVNSGAQGSTYTLRGDANYQVNGRTKFQASYDSNNIVQVKTLINGNMAPPLAGFGGQKPITQCIANYINPQNGFVKLAANQVLLLFELGTNMVSNPTSSAADFQDLVTVMEIN